MDIVMAGDMNNGPKGLPKEMPHILTNPTFSYQHSVQSSAIKKDGTSIAVDAVFSTEKSIPLQIQRKMNTCDKAFLEQFDKSKKEKEQLAQQEKANQQLIYKKILKTVLLLQPQRCIRVIIGKKLSKIPNRIFQ